jgi:hypothetical protein
MRQCGRKRGVGGVGPGKGGCVLRSGSHIKYWS